MKSKILEQAAEVINQRRETHGDHKKVLSNIAARWTLRFDRVVTVRDVIACMIDLKLERWDRSPLDEDNPLDIAGYAALWDAEE